MFVFNSSICLREFLINHLVGIKSLSMLPFIHGFKKLNNPRLTLKAVKFLDVKGSKVAFFKKWETSSIDLLLVLKPT